MTTKETALSRLKVCQHTIEKALDVCVDVDCSDPYKVGYCESGYNFLQDMIQELTDLVNSLPEGRS